MRVSKTDRLRAVLAGGGDLDALLASWVSDVRAAAVGAARRVGVHRHHEVEEVESLAWEEVARMVAEERSGMARVSYNFDAHLVMRLRNAVRSWMDSEAGHAPAARMSSVLRRRRAILAMIGRGVSLEEAVGILNAAGRRDGVYSAADLTVELATRDVDDPALSVPARLGPDEVAELMMGPEAGYVLAPFEGRAFVEDVTADVAHVDDDAARVVHEWLRTAWEGDEAATVGSLARRLGVDPVEVEAAIDLGRWMAAGRLMSLGVSVASGSCRRSGRKSA